MVKVSLTKYNTTLASLNIDGKDINAVFRSLLDIFMVQVMEESKVTVAQETC